MGVGSTDSEGTDPGGCRQQMRRPGHGPGVDVEGTGGEIDLRIGGLEIDGRRQRAVLERHDRLDQAGDPGRRIEMADVALDRTDGTLLRRAGLTESLRQRGDLDRIPQNGTGAMRFDITDLVRLDAGHGQRGPDDAGLPLHAGGGEAHLVGTIAVDGSTADDGVDVIAIAQRILETPQHDDARPAAQHGAAGTGIEGAAVPVTRQDGTIAIEITAVLQQVQRHATGQGRVAFLRQQRLAGHVHSHQRGRAGRLHGDGRSLEVELVGDARGQRVGTVAAHHRQHVENGAARGQRRAGQQMTDQIGRRAATTEDADGVVVLRTCTQIACVLQRMPGRFQKQALLRIEQLGIARRETEQRRIELIHVCERNAAAHVVRIMQHRRRHTQAAQLGIAVVHDGLGAVEDVLP